MDLLAYFIERNYKHIMDGVDPTMAALRAQSETFEKLSEAVGSCEGHPLPQPPEAAA